MKTWNIPFLEPLYKELKILRDGVTVNISKLVKAILIAEPFDLPARCLVSGTIQFNGKHGCIKCLQTGESCTAAKGGYIWVYPFSNENPKRPLRDNKRFKQLEEAYHENKLVLVSKTQHGYMI